MSEKVIVSVNDFDLFCEVIKSTSKVIDSAKIFIDETGLQIYGIHGRVARCEITSNAIFSQTPTSFCILDLNLLVKVLSTVREVHDGDYSDFNFIIDNPFIRFQSKRFKTKLTTCSEDVISKFTSHKIEAEMTSVFDFTTSSDLIRRACSHSYVFQDPNMLRVYLEVKEDMENNAVFATIGNRSTDLNNEMTLKFGLVQFGDMKDKNIILDLDRLQVMNAVQANEIKVSLMDKGCLVSKTLIKGKKDTFFSFVVLNSLLKS